MVWCSGWELAAAVSNAGGLGIIGSGSMDADTLRVHIQKCKAATDRPFAVNTPLLYRQIGDNMAVILEEGVPIVFTSPEMLNASFLHNTTRPVVFNQLSISSIDRIFLYYLKIIELKALFFRTPLTNFL